MVGGGEVKLNFLVFVLFFEVWDEDERLQAGTMVDKIEGNL